MSRPPAMGPSEPAGPVFVGGTGRSGTTVLARLIGTHSRFAMIPFELRFHVRLMRVVEGSRTDDDFVSGMRARWGKRTGGSGIPQRARILISDDQLEAALASFTDSFEEDPAAASRDLVRTLVDLVVGGERKPSWVDSSPASPTVGNGLLKVFPEMRLIHIVRDGRDVASSLAERRGRASEHGFRPAAEPGTGEPALMPGSWEAGASERWTALRRGEFLKTVWHTRLRRCDKRSRELPDDRFLLVRFEDLLVHERERSYERLLEFLGVEDEPAMRSFFENGMVPERANVGRWRKGLSHEEQEHLTAVYSSALDRLREANVTCAAALSASLSTAPGSSVSLT